MYKQTLIIWIQFVKSVIHIQSVYITVSSKYPDDRVNKEHNKKKG